MASTSICESRGCLLSLGECICGVSLSLEYLRLMEVKLLQLLGAGRSLGHSCGRIRRQLLGNRVSLEEADLLLSSTGLDCGSAAGSVSQGMGASMHARMHACVHTCVFGDAGCRRISEQHFKLTVRVFCPTAKRDPLISPMLTRALTKALNEKGERGAGCSSS